MGDLILRSATIVFSLKQGDDKDTDTGVSVFISARYNNQFDLQIASRQHFANTDTWEDTGDKGYNYDLAVAPVGLLQITGDVKTRIVIWPVGNGTR